MTSEKAVLKCRYCSKVFTYDSERMRHEKSHFPQFQCKVCSKNFSFISALRRHEKQHQRTGSVQCNECGREFLDEILLKRHTKYAHGGTYVCTKCSAIFSSEPALSTHMKTHKLESERQYQCSFNGCTKKFNFAHHLKHHELTHTNTKQYYCKICNKGFIQSHHLKAHMKTHTADLSLCCSFPDCSKKFSTVYAKKRHLTKHHIKADSGISSDSNSACDFSFAAKNKLENEVITCSSCELVIPKSQYEKHIFSCVRNLKEEHVTTDPPAFPVTCAVSENATDNNSTDNNSTDSPNTSVNDEISNCKLVLGSCIMPEKGEKCLCAQITKAIDEDYDFTPIDNNEPINMTKVNNNVSNFCEGCQCFERCNVEIGFQSGDHAVAPVIEYKTDGTVKIKDIFDMDIPSVDNVKIADNSISKNDAKNDAKLFPFNSCKAVLGRCIVSGNGTMSEECLCARMILDDQVTAQEIDDITPRPNV